MRAGRKDVPVCVCVGGRVVVVATRWAMGLRDAGERNRRDRSMNNNI